MFKLDQPFVPDFDRVRATVERRATDRIPNFELHIAPEVRSALLGRPAQSGLAGELECRRQWGFDYLYLIPPYRKSPVYSQATGDQAGDRHWVDQHSSMITDFDSFRAYVAAGNYAQPGSLVLDEVHEAIRVAKTLPGNTGVGALMPCAPFQEACLLMGYEDFAIMLHENYELCEAMVAMIGQVGVASMEQLCQVDGLDFIFFGDDMAYTGGMMVSPPMMRQLFFPWYRRFIQMARAAGKLIFFHSDGDLRPVIPDFIAAGLQALNPIEPLAMDIVALQQEFGHQLTLIGNIDVDLLTRGTPEQVAAQVQERVAQLGPQGGWMIASSNSVCDYVKPENYAAMLQASSRFGGRK